MTPRKSKYNLENPAYLKVPREIFHKLVEQAGEKYYWSEVARHILNWWVENEQDIPTKEAI